MSPIFLVSTTFNSGLNTFLFLKKNCNTSILISYIEIASIRLSTLIPSRMVCALNQLRICVGRFGLGCVGLFDPIEIIFFFGGAFVHINELVYLIKFRSRNNLRRIRRVVLFLFGMIGVVFGVSIYDYDFMFYLCSCCNWVGVPLILLVIYLLIEKRPEIVIYVNDKITK